MRRNGDDLVWEWYLIIEDFKKSGLKARKYSIKNNLNHQKFCNFLFRIVYKSHTNPEWYKNMVTIVRKYMETGGSRDDFAKNNGINRTHLCQMVTHLNYVDLIEDLKYKKGLKNMNFIEVQNPTPKKEIIVSEPEVIDARNDIELIISKGIRVIIAPGIESMKIIKIIELLKDL